MKQSKLTVNFCSPNFFTIWIPNFQNVPISNGAQIPLIENIKWNSRIESHLLKSVFKSQIDQK